MDLSKEIKKDNCKKYNFYKKIVQSLFVYSLIFYLLFYLCETLSSGFVSSFYQLNYHLWLVIITGVLSVIFEPKKEEESDQVKQSKTKKALEYLFIFVVTVISAVVIYFKIREIGFIAYVIALLSGFIIFLLSSYILFDKENNK